jgi:hypothetical protein
MVLVLSSPPFYTRHIQLPGNNDLCPPEIHNNSKFWPYFEDVLSALNAVTSNAPLLPIHTVYIKIGKGFFLQNCLFVLSFNMYFTYSLCGWEGAACKGTSVRFLTSPLLSYYPPQLPLFICILPIPLYYLQESYPKPTTLVSNSRRLSRSRLTKCHWLPTSSSARTLAALDKPRTHWYRSA